MQKNWQKFLIFLIILIIPAAISWGLYLAAGGPQPEHAQHEEGGSSPGGMTMSSKFPEELGGMHQAAFLEGDAAKAEISQLHQGKVSVEDGYIVTYSDNTYAAKIWISKSSSTNEAATLVESMTKRMQSNPTVFSAPQGQTVAGKTVFFTVGQGMKNYYYQSDTWVIWIATTLPDDRAGPFLEQALNSLKPGS